MGKFVFGALAIVMAAMPLAAKADDLKLSGKKHWLTLASTKDVDAAIGIARNVGNGAQVVSSQSGYFAVVLGPYAANSIAQVKKLDENVYEVPKDALLSDGARYTASLWKAPSRGASLFGYEIDKPAQLSSGDVSAELKLVKVGEDLYSTVATGGQSNGPRFNFTVDDTGDNSPSGAEAGFMNLDATMKVPQLVFTRYSGGAHCCTNTWIALMPDGGAGWSLIDAGKLDGGGFSFEDVDGDGAMEMLSNDNSFLYAFDSYAASFAPIKISKLRGGKIEDVSEEPAMMARLRQDLAGLEFNAKMNPSLWKQNGFLAGWAASKVRLGQGEEAWQTVAENANLRSDFGPQECLTGQLIEECPAEKLKTIPVLKALAGFLKEGGYGPLPDAAEALLR